MRIVWTVRTAAVLGLVLAGFALVGIDDSAEARPGYPKMFTAQYKNLEEQAKTAKCGVCHLGGTNKKLRNDYGKALAVEILKIDKKGNLKDSKKYEEISKKVEKEPSGTPGKTFGDLIKEGKLPGKEEKKN
jgi:hypothetical protein